MKNATIIEEVIRSPKREYTISEAQQMLRKYGVLTTKNNVTKAYSHIVVKTKDGRRNGSK